MNNIINRPSRFDQKYEVTDPEAEDRKLYLEKKITPEDWKKLGLNVDKVVKDTAGFTMSHLKEFVISLIVYEWEYQKSLDQLKNMSTITKESAEAMRKGYAVANKGRSYGYDECV